MCLGGVRLNRIEEWWEELFNIFNDIPGIMSDSVILEGMMTCDISWGLVQALTITLCENIYLKENNLKSHFGSASAFDFFLGIHKILLVVLICNISRCLTEGLSEGL